MINYDHIAHAAQCYTKLGYTNIEVPWMVSPPTHNITSPPDRFVYDVLRENGSIECLVASGEQSFLQLLIDKKIQLDVQYFCTTPCFRQEPIYDRLHLNQFLKTELFVASKSFDRQYNLPVLYDMIDDALHFFSQYVECSVISTGKDTYDIETTSNHIELGSYGIRTWNNIIWIYGTGIAEPRLSTAIEILDEMIK